MLFVTDTPVIAGHPQLAERRHIARSDVGAFSVVSRVQVAGALPPDADLPPALLRSHLDNVDPRLERVTGQEYMRLAVIRRDATFEMCAMSAKLVLSGDELRATTTDYALWPIKFRALVWTLSFIAVFTVSVVFLAARSPLPYFETANGWIRGLIAIGLALSLPALGILLRQLRKSGTLRPLDPLELGVVAACVLCFGGAVATAKASQPRLSEIETALARKDVSRARLILGALLSTQGRGPESIAAEDRVDLAEAEGAAIESKLSLLDGVVARNGAQASTAAKLARSARLSVISEFIKTGNAVAAVNATTRWYGNGARDADVGELYAQAEEQLLTGCADALCRFDAAKKANTAAPTAHRAAVVATHRAALLESLTFQPAAGENLPARLVRLRELGDQAAAARDVVAGDEGLRARLEQASILASTERAKVALIGAQEPVVEELLGSLSRKTSTVSQRSSGTAEIFVVFDQQRRCRGVYLVGSQPKARAIPGAAATALLSQTVGHTSSLKSPTASGLTSRWFEGGVPVVARWTSSRLVELRVGDAAP